MGRLVAVFLALSALAFTSVTAQASYRVDYGSGHAVWCSSVASNLFEPSLSGGRPETIPLRHLDDYLPQYFPTGVVPVAFLVQSDTVVMLHYRYANSHHSTPWLLKRDWSLVRIWVPHTWATTISFYSEGLIQLFPCYARPIG